MVDTMVDIASRTWPCLVDYRPLKSFLFLNYVDW